MGRKKGSTSEKAEMRLTLATTKISLGWSPSEIRDCLMSEGLSRAQAERYLYEARQFFRARAHADRQLAFGEALERFDLLFRKAVEAEQFGPALAAQREKGNLLGLTSLLYPYREEPEKKVKPTLLGEIAARMDSAQRERMIGAIQHMNALLKEYGPYEAEIRNGISDMTAKSLKGTVFEPMLSKKRLPEGATGPTPSGAPQKLPEGPASELGNPGARGAT